MFNKPFSSRTPVRRNRGVGYCQNPACEDWGKGIFLLNTEGKSQCPECRLSLYIELETWSVSGDTSDWCSVRIEYCFEYANMISKKIEKRYCDVAIITDINVAPDLGVYTLRSPLIKTKERALKVAEQLFGTLLIAGCGPDGITAREDILVIDDSLPEFQRKLKLFENERLAHR